eukprot:gene14183-20151_t
MGLDGGTTMTRSDILRASSWRVANQDNTRSTRGGSISQSNTAYKEESVAKEDAAVMVYTTCALSDNPLQPPVVADYLGCLFYRSAVLEYQFPILNSMQEESVAKEDAAVMVYTTCALSDEPLQPPVVADYLGRLFNRSAVLEFLLAKKKDHFVDGAAGRLFNRSAVLEFLLAKKEDHFFDGAAGRLFNRSAVLEFLLAKKKDHFVDGAAGVHRLANTLRAAAGGSDHLESMKDVFAIKLENVEAAAGGPSKSSQNETSKTAMEAPTSLVPYSCPITMLPCTRYLFSALPRCGHVLSNRALTNIKEQLEDLKARLADRSIAQRAAKRRKTKETKGAASLPLSNAPVSSVLLLEAPSDKSPVLLPEASSEIL